MASLIRDKSSEADVLVNIGSIIEYLIPKRLKSLDYNVSKFIQDYESMGSDWHQKLDKFIKQLDNKVKIDKNDAKHKPILEGLDIILNKICEELPKRDGRYVGMKHYKCGSMYAGLRVGRPYEGDILLEINENVQIYHGLDFDIHIIDIVKQISLDNWIIHGVKIHGVGVCLVLEYRPNGEEKDAVAVLTDLVTCQTIKGDVESHELTAEARSLLKSIDTQIDYHKYKLITFAKEPYRLYGLRSDIDSGYIQHQLLEHLPEDLKFAYRVAKYLLQFCVVWHQPSMNEESNKYTEVVPLSEEKSRHLYGYKTFVKSHVLQLFLFYVLTQTHETPAASKLRGSTLTICLLDMLHYTVTEGRAATNFFLDVHVKDSVIAGLAEEVCITNNKHEFFAHKTIIKFIQRSLDVMTCNFIYHASVGACALSFYPLCNRSDDVINYLVKYAGSKEGLNPDKDEAFLDAMHDKRYPGVLELKLTGFCRGASPESMAAVGYACDAENYSSESTDVYSVHFPQSPETYVEYLARSSHEIYLVYKRPIEYDIVVLPSPVDSFDPTYLVYSRDDPNKLFRHDIDRIKEYEESQNLPVVYY